MIKISTYVVRNPKNLCVQSRRFNVIKSTYGMHVWYAYTLISVNVESGDASVLGCEVLATPDTLEE